MNLFFDGMEKLYSFDGIKFEGDFALGFASQSLPLTWGTGPRWLRNFKKFLTCLPKSSATDNNSHSELNYVGDT